MSVTFYNASIGFYRCAGSTAVYLYVWEKNKRKFEQTSTNTKPNNQKRVVVIKNF